ncbi:MAG TPA: hypothetical protein VFZ24_02375 [Longimicrobiales bacterium]
MSIVSRSVVLATLMTAAAAVVAPAADAEHEIVPTCTDGAWADYNSCLVGAGSEFGRRMCDLRFVLDLTLCAYLE